jgi:hypothetical protein
MSSHGVLRKERRSNETVPAPKYRVGDLPVAGLLEVKYMPRNQKAKPKNVVVVDADNPMVEVTGEFYWREDHEALLEAGKRDAYAAGWSDAMRSGGRHSELMIRWRRPWHVRMARRLLAVAVLLGMAILLIAILAG